MFDNDEKKFLHHTGGLFPPEKSNLTLHEDMLHTITSMRETIDRMMKFEVRVENKVSDLMSKLTSDNVLFKDTFNNAYKLFLQEVKNEINLFESNVDNTVKLFGDNLKTDYENLDTDMQGLIVENLKTYDEKLKEFETTIFNSFKEKVESMILNNANSNAEISADFQRKLTTELNMFEADVNNAIRGFTTSMTESFETFKTSWTEIVENRLDTQDQKIANAENYMKTNLEATVRTELGDMYDSGDFAEILEGEVFNDIQDKMNEIENDVNTTMQTTANNVEKRVETVEKRMDNIIATNDTATEGNAELLDIRVGADGVTYQTAGESVRTQVNKVFQPFKYHVNDNHSAYHKVTDMNNLEDNRVYIFSIKELEVANLPEGYKDGNTNLRFVKTMSYYYNTALCKNQLITDFWGRPLWFREFLSNGTWDEWKDFNNYDDSERSIKTFKYHVNDNHSAYHKVTDMNNLEDNRVYIFSIKNLEVANLPEGYKDGNTNLRFVKTMSYYYNTALCKNQLITDFWGRPLWFREFLSNGTWSAWKTSPTNEIHVGSGYEYTTLREGIAKGVELGCKVIVHAGTYDLTEEFATELANESGSGIELGKHVHVIFDSGAFVKCNIPATDNTWAYYSFEPFYATGDFTLENANIETSNCRYCVHDDTAGNGEYTHKFINCVMKHNHTIDESLSPHYIQCIGGGMGNHTTVIIDGGYYECNRPAKTDEQIAISYHNASGSTAQGVIHIKNVYLADNNYMRFTHYGNSPNITKVYMCGCSYDTEPLLTSETTTSTVENMALIKWNNELRN